LFSVSYKVKFNIKKSDIAIDYGVLPLEGLWWIENGDFNLKDKSNWKWTLMVRQPDFVTENHIEAAKADVKKKKDNKYLESLRLDEYKEGLSIQILHTGPYSEEQSTIDKLHSYIEKNNFSFNGKHHEIYLNDPTRTAAEKLKTIIRQPVES
jgi:hypothetical protein